jgi:hypothetical protein
MLMLSKNFLRFCLACLGITGLAMFVAGITRVARDAQTALHWVVVTGSGAANCLASVVGLRATRTRRENSAKN